jgi:hypothetical protein
MLKRCPRCAECDYCGIILVRSGMVLLALRLRVRVRVRVPC